MTKCVGCGVEMVEARLRCAECGALGMRVSAGNSREDRWARDSMRRAMTPGWVAHSGWDLFPSNMR